MLGGLIYILADCEGRELRNKSQVNKSTEPRKLYYEDCTTKITLRRSGLCFRSFAQIERTNDGTIWLTNRNNLPWRKNRRRRCMRFLDGVCFSRAERSMALFGFVMWSNAFEQWHRAVPYAVRSTVKWGHARYGLLHKNELSQLCRAAFRKRRRKDGDSSK